MDFKNEFVSLRKLAIEKEFSKMNEMQRDAVFHINGPLLILAGAGSGKTTVLVNRIANLIKYGDAYNSEQVFGEVTQSEVDYLKAYLDGRESSLLSVEPLMSVRPAKPWKILAITFTNKAAGELKERINTMLGSGGEEVWASTFHATCARMLRRDADLIGFSKQFTIYDTDDSKRLMKEVQRELEIDDKKLPHKSILSEISKAKDQMIVPDEYMNLYGNDFRLKQIAQCYKLYQQKLKKSDAMDFDDLLNKTVELLTNNDDVLEYYQNRFSYIHVDEYQDTNKVQFKFISLLASSSQNLCVVGDDDQSIYKFRGATIENILSFEHIFNSAKVIKLEQNYRSTQTILDAANAVISNNRERKGKNLWTQNGEGKKITDHTALDEQEEAAYIADSVFENVQNGSSYKDHAVLYRMNAQSNAVERAFVRRGIPYRIIGGHRFYDRMEIKDMLAYLHIINNLNDNVRLNRIVNVPKRGIGDASMQKASQIADGLGLSLFEVLKTADQYEVLSRSSNKMIEFSKMIGYFLQMSEQMSIHELYELVLNKSGYMMMLENAGEEGLTRIENVNELSSNLLKYEQENGDSTSLSGFLEEVSLLTDIDNYNQDNDSVVMMTLHAAKGLEFPFVYLPGLEEGIFPGFQSMFEPKEVEEERRLAYVGITRAKKELYILHCQSRMLFGNTSRNKVSRFASEIPENLLECTRPSSFGGFSKSTSGMGAPSGFGWGDIPKSQNKSSFSGGFGGSSIGIKGTEPSAKSEVFKPGDRVEHKTFGQGMVLSVAPMGNDYLIEIAFDTKGSKKLMSNFAKLSKI